VCPGVYLSTRLLRGSRAGSEQHGHVQRVHAELLQSVEDGRRQVGALTRTRPALQQQPGAVRGRPAQHTPTHTHTHTQRNVSLISLKDLQKDVVHWDSRHSELFLSRAGNRSQTTTRPTTTECRYTEEFPIKLRLTSWLRNYIWVCSFTSIIKIYNHQ